MKLDITREQFIAEWVAALRSGKYPQAQGSLRTDAGFCCLGVACDIASKHGGPDWEGGSHGDVFEYDNENGALPGWLGDWLLPSPEYTVPIYTMLAFRNDEHGETFAELAGVIERQLS
jgi:hypothetical protein